MFITPEVSFGYFVRSFISTGGMFTTFVRLTLFTLHFSLSSSALFSVYSVNF